MVLNDVADMCYFADTEAYIEITSEYVVDTLSDEQHSEKIDNLHHMILKMFLNKKNTIL